MFKRDVHGFILYFGLSIIFALISPSSFAQTSSGITYQGRLLSPHGTPVTGSNVQFRLQVRTPGSEDCLLYEEIQSQDMSSSNGMFAISLGDGSGARQDGYAWTLFDSFSNRMNFSFNPGDCSGATTYSPNASDNRRFRVYFNDGSFAGWEALPIQAINFIPMAIETYTVGGFPASSLLRVENAGGTLVNTSPLNNTQYTELLALLAGTSSQYTRAGQLNGVAIPVLGAGDVLSWNGAGWSAVTPLTSFTELDPGVEAFAKSALPVCAAGEALAPNGLGTALECVTAGGAASLPDQAVTPGSYAKVTINQKGIVTAHGSLAEGDIPQLTGAGNGVDGGAITGGEIGGAVTINTSGSIATSGTLSTTSSLSVTGNASISGNQTVNGISTAGAFSSQQFNIYDSDNSNSIRFQSPNDVPVNYTLTFPPALGSANQILGMNAAGNALENKSLTAGSGITLTHSPNGLEISADGSGTVTGVSGTAPVQVNNTNPATPVVSVDSATTSTAGVVTLASDGGTTAGTVVQGNDSRLNDSRAPSGNAGGDLGGTYPDPSVNAIRGVGVTVTAPTESGHVLRFNSTNYTPGFLSLADIRSTVGPTHVTAFPTTGCAESETLTWSSLTDTLSCTEIKIGMAQITDYTSLWTEDSGNVYRATGNVGIGTTNPAARLDVANGSIRINEAGGDGSAIKITERATGYGGKLVWLDESDAFSAAITKTVSDSLGFYTGGLHTASYEKMVITSDGNVGIGTANPLAKMHIDGGGIRLSHPSVTTPTFFDVVSNGSTYWSSNLSPTDTIIDETKPQWRMALSQAQDIFSISRGAPGTTWSGVPLFRINSNGKVGIGTSTPSVALDLGTKTDAVLLPSGTSAEQPSSPANGMIRYNSENNKFEAYENGNWINMIGGISSVANSVSASNGSAASPSISFSGNSNTGFYSSGTNQIGISANGVKVWDITASGIVSPTVGGASIKTAAGTAGAPTFSFSGDEDTGWFRPLENNLAAATGGAERIRIDHNGNVGIGTTNPTNLLSLSKTTATATFNDALVMDNPVNNGPGTGSSLKLKAIGVDGIRLYSWIRNATTGNEHTDFGIDGFRAGAWVNHLYIRSDTGRIGMGTSSPAALLQIGSASNNLNALQFGSANSLGVTYSDAALTLGNNVRVDTTNNVPGRMNVITTASSGAAAIKLSGNMSGTANDGIQFHVTGDTVTAGNAFSAEAMRINYDGNVGIGTTNPSQKIEIAAENSTGYFGARVARNEFNGGGLIVSRSRGTIETPLAVNANDIISSIYSDAYDGSAYHTAASIDTRVDGLVSSGIVPGRIDFTTQNTAGTKAVHMTVKNDGKVGIGTVGPSAKLHSYVNYGALPHPSGYASPYLRLQTQYNSGSHGTYLNFSSIGDGTHYVGNNISSGYGYLSLGAPGAGGQADTLVVSENRVGIGTTNPLSALHVSNTATTTNAVANLESTGAGGRPFLNFRAEAQNYGYVGYGSAGNDTLILMNYKNDDLVLGTNSLGRLRIDGDGNVGIGTTDPRDKLEVNGGGLYIHDMAGTGHAIRISERPTGYGSKLSWLDETAAVSAAITKTNQDALAFYTGGAHTAGTEKLLITTGGNVGIGITNPTHNLHVIGTAGLSTGTAWTNTSDERLKDIHGRYSHGLNEIKQLSTVNFSYKKDNPLGLPSDKVITGFIAQDVQKVIPEAVITREDGYLELNVDPIHWATVNAVQELAERCEMSEEQQSQLARQVAVHDREIASLKKENEKLKKDMDLLRSYLCQKDPQAPFCR